MTPYQHISIPLQTHCVPTPSRGSLALFISGRGVSGLTQEPPRATRNQLLASDISFKKTFCLMNIRPQDLLSHEPTLWFRRHQLFWFRRTIFLRPQTAAKSLNKCFKITVAALKLQVSGVEILSVQFLIHASSSICICLV